jgi:hypothetical protein
MWLLSASSWPLAAAAWRQLAGVRVGSVITRVGGLPVSGHGVRGVRSVLLHLEQQHRTQNPEGGKAFVLELTLQPPALATTAAAAAAEPVIVNHGDEAARPVEASPASAPSAGAPPQRSAEEIPAPRPAPPAEPSAVPSAVPARATWQPPRPAAAQQQRGAVQPETLAHMQAILKLKTLSPQTVGSRLRFLYARKAPHSRVDVSGMLTKYKGREAPLLAAMMKKYDVDEAFFDELRDQSQPEDSSTAVEPSLLRRGGAQSGSGGDGDSSLCYPLSTQDRPSRLEHSDADPLAAASSAADGGGGLHELRGASSGDGLFSSSSSSSNPAEYRLNIHDGSYSPVHRVPSATGSAAAPAYEHLWKELGADLQQAAAALGWDADSWDDADQAPFQQNWAELSAGQLQAAALLGLGRSDFAADQAPEAR